VKIALTFIGVLLLAVVGVTLLVSAFAPKEKPAQTGITPSAPASRGESVGYGNPNEPCATNRLGESFKLNGITYTCSGPKPYRWRAQK